jgi:hypothetical protein
MYQVTYHFSPKPQEKEKFEAQLTDTITPLCIERSTGILYIYEMPVVVFDHRVENAHGYMKVEMQFPINLWNLEWIERDWRHIEKVLSGEITYETWTAIAWQNDQMVGTACIDVCSNEINSGKRERIFIDLKYEAIYNANLWKHETFDMEGAAL